MEFDLKFGNKAEILERQAMFTGEDLGIVRPVLEDSLFFYYNAFFDLCTERIVAFDLTPIPVTKIIQYYSMVTGIERGCEVDSFVYLIRKMDNFYVSYMRKKDK